MRWSGQEIQVEQGDALPGLVKLSSLVRSVQTPEFAGITFHEVLAKSALNHVPAAAALPFGWTINPYRGCSHACFYCLGPDTLILMGDGRHKPLWQVEVGDTVYGTEQRGDYRRYVRTTVRAKWSTRKRPYRVTLGDGTELVSSADHRFLSDRGWKYVKGAESGAQRRPHLTPNNRLQGFGLNGLSELQQPAFFTTDYRRGYLTGMIRGDGMIFHKSYEDPRGRMRAIHRFRLALADVEALNRSRLFLSQEGIETLTRPFVAATERRSEMMAIHTVKEASVSKIEEVISWPDQKSDDWRAGYLAGIFDAEGSNSRGVLRISNSNDRMLSEVQSAMAAFGLSHVRERANAIGVANVRVVGGLPMRSRFFALTGPAITRKLDIEGLAVKTVADLRIMSIERLGGEIDMIDITTGTGDFIANGVISHNCFARNTHTYLDLDAGKDFDNQIIVKVNVAEVLERELAKPSWGHHPVALGTNTDPYQRAEGRYRLMPGIIAALAASGTPFSILTKGSLLRRDLPLLQEAAEHVPVDLSMSIAIYDDELQNSVEPGTPTTAARLATVKAAREAGLPCAVFLMPVLPYLTDSIEHLDRAFGLIAEAGATSVAYTALHLRPGAREWYLAWIAREHPELVGRYEDMYRGNSYAPKDYRSWLAARVQPLLRKHGLDRQPRIDPATGAVRARSGSRTAGAIVDATGNVLPAARGLIAAELSPAAAAAIQPTLF